MEILRCRVCGGSEGRGHLAREMMFGLRETFPYFECAGCGCLQITKVPHDLASHYPPGYAAVARRPDQGLSALGRFLHRARARHALGARGAWGALGALARRRLGSPRSAIFGAPDPYTWLRACGAHPGSRILDVGCGGGTPLLELHRDGFRHLTLVVRMPLVDSEAWRTYGTDWVQLDAPRHLTLHTRLRRTGP